MDDAVALVRAYLRVNGCLTVTEHPIVESLPAGGFQTSTNLDVLGFRFSQSCTLHAAAASDGTDAPCEIETDPARAVRPGTPDMAVGEGKEGRAALNRAASNPGVIAAALARFGCCEPAHAVVRADGVQMLACWRLSPATFAGLALNTTLGWAWADPVSGLLPAPFIIKEARSAWRGEACGCAAGACETTATGGHGVSGA